LHHCTPVVFGKRHNSGLAAEPDTDLAKKTASGGGALEAVR
jgi:hypothetical protein